LKYSEFENHQTGNKGDIATSQWIADELKEAGLKTELKPWKLRQFFLKAREMLPAGSTWARPSLAGPGKRDP
jgi:hypothetical protein